MNHLWVYLIWVEAFPCPNHLLICEWIFLWTLAKTLKSHMLHTNEMRWIFFDASSRHFISKKKLQGHRPLCSPPPVFFPLKHCLLLPTAGKRSLNHRLFSLFPSLQIDFTEGCAGKHIRWCKALGPPSTSVDHQDPFCWWGLHSDWMK